MKKFLPFLSLAIVFAACNSKTADTEVKSLQAANQSEAKVDTAGFAKFQQWKAQNELNATDVQQQPVVQTPVKEVTVIRERIIERQRPVKQTPVKEKEEVVVPTETENTGSGNTETASNSGNSNGTTESTTTVPEEKKNEGWSKAAKGGVIGGASGAVLGAIINKKNPAVGAVIGGVLGGAVGYGIGKSKDKKDGRN